MKNLIPLTLGMLAFCFPSVGFSEEVLFEEVFTANPGPQWVNVLNRGQATIKFLEDGEPALRVNNHVLGYDLPLPVKESFELEVETLHGEDGAFLWFGVFDALLENGYAVGWQAPPGGSTGRLGIYKVVLKAGDKPEILFKGPDGARQAELLGTEVKSLHGVMEAPPAKLKLAWNKEAGSLILSYDGEELASVVDTHISEFEGVLISGNKDSLFRSVKIHGK